MAYQKIVTLSLTQEEQDRTIDSLDRVKKKSIETKDIEHVTFFFKEGKLNRFTESHQMVIVK